jgi:hypothetical protein
LRDAAKAATMSIDPGALARLRVRIEEALGVDDTAALLDPLAHVRWDRLVTIDDLERFATKDDLRGFATKDDLRGFATKDDLQGFATREEVAAEVRQAELRLREYFERRLAEHQSQIRRDLLLITGGQFFALVAAVAAVLGLG